MHNHSYENEFNLHVNEISFSYEKMGTKTRFEEEAKGNSEMAYSLSFHYYTSKYFFFAYEQPTKKVTDIYTQAMLNWKLKVSLAW